MIDELNITEIKVISEPINVSQQAFMLRYVLCLAEKAETAELRSRWTMVYKYLSKQIAGAGRKK